MKRLMRAVCLMSLAFALPFARADWPDKPVHFVVPFGPGGANDLIARAAAEAVSKRIGQPIIIDNKPGAGALIGADYVAKSKPDGYTFLIGAAGVVTNSLLRKTMPYQDADLVPVGMIAVAPSVIVVHPSVAAKDLKEFVAWTRSQKDGVNWSTAGGGSTPHFVAEMLKEAGANLTIVPYKSGSEGVTAVISNNVSGTSEASIVVIPQIKAGKLKALATTYDTRITAYNTLPTTKEVGYPDVRIGHWAALFAPKGTPQPIIDKLSGELQAALKGADLRDKLIPNGIEPAPMTREAFIKWYQEERDRLGRIAKKSKMTVDE
jgi:tripartite-type tricarboxylate transporter receptor subunit TctC